MELAKTSLLSDANLKAYYKLEANGNDSSGNGYNLTTVTGSPDYVQAVFGNGIDCDNNERVSAAINCGIASGNCSVAFWVKGKVDITSGESTMVQLNTGDTNDLGYGVTYQYNSGTRRLYFRRSKWNVAHEGPTYNLTLGTSNWYHVVCTYDGTNVRGYVNGALVAGPTAASGNGSGTTAALTTIAASGFAAYYDDVAIFNKALTAAEVEKLYYKGARHLIAD
jgi:hypothetical protein